MHECIHASLFCYSHKLRPLNITKKFTGRVPLRPLCRGPGEGDGERGENPGVRGHRSRVFRHQLFRTLDVEDQRGQERN
jgi:hypothetical protein